MIKEERWEQILSLLREKKYLSVQKLSKLLYVSLPTVRRDLAELERRGLVIRNHGGAKLPAEGHSQIPIGFRNSFKMTEKRKLCEAVAALVSDGDVIYLDTSTTFLPLADLIRERKGIIVVTNSLLTAAALAESGIKTFCPGGLVNDACMSFIGSEAESFVSNFNFDIAFFSAYGVNAQGEIVDTMTEEIALRRVALKNSERAVFVCNGEKFNLSAPFKFTHLSNMYRIITDTAVPSQFSLPEEKLILV